MSRNLSKHTKKQGVAMTAVGVGLCGIAVFISLFVSFKRGFPTIQCSKLDVLVVPPVVVICAQQKPLIQRST